MRYLRWLALLPGAAILGGAALFNRVTPFILGMPFLLGWITLSILLTSAVMAIIYSCDPANRQDDDR